MTAAGSQWVEQDRPIGDVRTHRAFQVRTAAQLNAANVRKLQRVLAGGETLPAIKVARVGKALYVVDGFHRLEAHRLQGLETIRAGVAKMSLDAAKAEASVANTKRGLGLSRKDRQRMLDMLIERGGHLEADGSPKSSRAIEAEMNHEYSHETIRSKMKALGKTIPDDVEFPEGKKAWGGGPLEEADLGEERASEAAGNLQEFAQVFFTLGDWEQKQLLGTARVLVAALERGEQPEQGFVAGIGRMDI